MGVCRARGAEYRSRPDGRKTERNRERGGMDDAYDGGSNAPDGAGGVVEPDGRETSGEPAMRPPHRCRRALPPLPDRCRARARLCRGRRLCPHRHGVPARRPVEHGHQAARPRDRRLDLPRVRAELEALRAQPAAAEHRRPGPRPDRQAGRRQGDHRLVRPVRSGRPGHRRQSAAEPHPAERTAPCVGLLPRHPRRREPPVGPARRPLGDLSAPDRAAAPRPR